MKNNNDAAAEAVEICVCGHDKSDHYFSDYPQDMFCDGIGCECKELQIQTEARPVARTQDDDVRERAEDIDINRYSPLDLVIIKVENLKAENERLKAERDELKARIERIFTATRVIQESPFNKTDLFCCWFEKEFRDRYDAEGRYQEYLEQL